MTIDKPKVVVLGAGSLFFGREAIWQMIHSEYLNTGTLALVDTNEDRLNKLVKLANMVVQETGVNLKIEGSTDRKEVLQNADFVVLSFAENSVKYRGITVIFLKNMESGCALETQLGQVGFFVR